MSFSDIIGIIGAAAAVAAAIYARRAYRAGRSQAQLADQRRQRDVRPRFNVTLQSSRQVLLSNAGGAVVAGYVLIDMDGQYRGTSFNFAEHHEAYVNIGFVAQSGSGVLHGSGEARVVVVIGKDTDGDWWDLLEDVPLEDRPPADNVSQRSLEAWALYLAGVR